MGYHSHFDRALERIAGRAITRAGQATAATPASGVKYWLEAEEKACLAMAFE